MSSFKLSPILILSFCAILVHEISSENIDTTSDKKVAVVIRGNKGVGLETVKLMCKKFNGDVYLTSVNEKSGKNAVAKLEREGLHPKFYMLNETSEENVQMFGQFLKQEYGGLDVLIYNVKMSSNKKIRGGNIKTKQIDMGFFEPFNNSQQLLPLLKKGARVVYVSDKKGLNTVYKLKNDPISQSIGKNVKSPSFGLIELQNLMKTFVELSKNGSQKDNGWPKSVLTVSKMGLKALTELQQKKAEGERPEDDIIVNAVQIGARLRNRFRKKRAAAIPVWAALLPPKATEPKGTYIYEKSKKIIWFGKSDIKEISYAFI